MSRHLYLCCSFADRHARKSKGYDNAVEDAVMFSVLLERFEGLEEHIEDLRDNLKAIRRSALLYVVTFPCIPD